MKLSEIMKKTTALVLTAAMLGGGVPSMGSVVLASDPAFDANNVVLRMGIISDMHVARGDLKTRKENVVKYANSVFALEALTEEHGLDALLLCGDYTDTGIKLEAETFASASKAIMDELGTDTKFVMTYGNHDTEWTVKDKDGNITSRSMEYTGWKTVLDKYGLLGDVVYGPEDSGSYKATIEKAGKTYTIFSIETELYNNPTNMFRTNVLTWLDEELDKTDKNSYVYVISHAPIQESGVFGSDMAFDTKGDWASATSGYKGSVTRQDGVTTYELSSSIDDVLNRYPHVMYFSGHTHRSNVLESTIMSKNYTAVSVANLFSSDLVNADDYPLDVLTEAAHEGYALYLEVDGDGNQRIRRIANPYEYGTCTVDDVTFFSQNTDTKELVVSSITKKDATVPDISLPAWTLDAPDADEQAHLERYQAETRQRTPVFADAAVTTSEVYLSEGELTLDVEFDAATCDNKIIRYEISLLNQSNED